MLSEAQARIKKENIAKVVRVFISTDYTIDEVAEQTKISSSSVQRYLNDEASIREIFGLDADYIIPIIKNGLKKNKQDGLVRGGTNSSQRNVALKDELGHFKGSRRK